MRNLSSYWAVAAVVVAAGCSKAGDGSITGAAGAELAKVTVAAGDTGTTATAGFGKLRVIHMAASTPTLEIWRTQPDYQTPISFAFPFTYGNNSGYDQSTPGTWDVRVWRETSEPNASHWNHPDGALRIDVPSGAVKTLIVRDSVGGHGYSIEIAP